MASEITEEEDEEEENTRRIFEDRSVERARIMQIIQYQKSIYSSSSSSSSFSSAAATNSSSPRKSGTLLDLMKGGSTSLGRLFDMEHTSLGNYFKDYSASPIVKPILLWGSDSDNDVHDDPWAGMRRIGGGFGSRSRDHFEQQQVMAEGDLCKEEGVSQHGGEGRKRRVKRRLIRTVSYKKLPRFSFWRCWRFRFRLKFIRRLRIMIRGRKF